MLDHVDVRYAGSSTAGILSVGAPLTLTNSIVRESYRHAVLATTSAPLTLSNNIIVNNGDNGIRATTASTVTAKNNTIVGNYIGVSTDAASVTLTNNIVSHNSRSGVAKASTGTVILSSNDVFNPGASSGNYEGLPDQTGLSANISSDPKFVNRTLLNFALDSRSAAIDAGTSTGVPTTDALGNPRFDDLGVANAGSGTPTFFDMGALERQTISDPINFVVLNTGFDNAQAGIGDTRVLHWTVTNNQTTNATATWSDAVFASTDDKFDINDVLVATVPHTGLAGGASYTAQATVTVPAFPAGTLYFIIRADSKFVVNESIETDNNVAVPLTITVPELPVATPTTGQFTAAGQSRYFKINAAAGGTLQIALTSSSGTKEMYASLNAIPTASEFDAKFKGAAGNNGTLVIPTTEAGSYYLLVQNVTGAAGSFTLNAQFLPYSITSVSPESIGNAGFATILLSGAQIAATDIVTLTAPDNTVITADAVTLKDAATLSASFNMTGKAVGTYQITVKHANGVVAQGAFSVNVVAATASDPVVQLIAPGALRVGRIIPYTVVVKNTGNNDVVMPLLTLDSHGAEFLGFTPDALQSTSLSIVPRTDGAPGILRPGQTWSLTVYGQIVPNHPRTPVNMTLDSIRADATPVNMQGILSMYGGRSLAQVYGNRAGEVEAFFNALVGTTNADFVRSIYLIADQAYSQLPEGATLSIEDVWQAATASFQMITHYHMLDQYYIDNDITFPGFTPNPGGIGNSVTNPSGLLPVHSSPVELPHHGDHGDGSEHVDITVRIPGSQTDTSVTTRYVGNGQGKTRYISAGFTASESYAEGDFPKQMADKLHCIFPNDTIKVVNWNSGTIPGAVVFAGTGAVLGAGAAAFFTGGLGAPIGAKIGGAIFGGIAYGAGYYFGRAGSTPKVASDIVSDIRQNGVEPGDVFLYGHSLGGQIMGHVGQQLNGQVPKIVAFDPAGEGFSGGPSGRLDPNDAYLVQVLHTSKTFGNKTHYVFGTNPEEIGWENYYPKDVEFDPVSAHGHSHQLYLARLTQRCNEINAHTKEVGDDSGILDGISTDPNNPDTIDPTKVRTGITSTTAQGSTANIVQAIDPNDIIGPAGYGPEGWIDLDSIFPYTIRFENDPKQATAPAQIVVITNPLDADLDLSTFAINTIGWGAISVQVPAGQQSFTANVDTTNTDGTPLRVHVVSSLNLATRVFTTTFTSLDPATGQLPVDALAGFLPVNDPTHRGEGFITYQVYPKGTLATGTPINNEASIIFDDNAPLLTPMVLNTIDNTGPNSSVAPLPPIAVSPQFKVRWSGQDAASGIANFDVYVSADGGPYALWQTATTETSADYSGTVGHTYSFYSRARDNAGNVETAPAQADASINAIALINTTLNKAGKYSFVDGNGSTVTVAFAAKSGSVTLGRAVADGQNGDLIAITFAGTDPAASLTITGKGGSDAGVTSVYQISGNSLVGKVTGKTLDLAYNGVLMTGAGAIATLAVRDLLNGADVVMPGTGAIKGLTLTLGKIDADSQMTLGSPVKGLTLATWAADGALTAPSVATLNVAGDKKRAITGNFSADVTLTNAASPQTLGKATIAGSLLGSRFAVAGNVGSITLGAMTDSQLLVGTAVGVNGLASTSADFVFKPAKPSLASLTIKGLVANSPSFTTSTVDAWSIGTASFKLVNTVGASPFGLAANQIASLSFQASGVNSGKAVKLTKLDTAADLDDTKKNPANVDFPIGNFRLNLI